jgi:cation:H+ antiporter
MTDLLLLISGIAAVLTGAYWMVTGASALAKRLGVSDLAIALTIVAFGTSSPELIVNLFSTAQGAPDLAIGNILGSNISNIFLILGISALVYPLPIKNNTHWKEIPFSLMAAIILAVAVNDIIIDNDAHGNFLSRIDGLMLLGFFIIFMVYVYGMAKRDADYQKEPIRQQSTWKSIAMVLAGMAGLFFGGKFLVDGAVNLAFTLGMSDKVIGLTIVAIGTSIPELATSVMAAIQKKTDIAVGNVVGSNIFNIFFVLGTTAVVKPIPFSPEVNFDLMVTILASLLLFATSFTLGKKKIVRLEGGGFVMLYLAYIIYLLV